MTRPIHIGIGGWTYDPWKNNFYPKDLPAKQELAYASRRLTAIEINGTFYRLQKPDTYRKWAAETPDGFVFTLKAHNFCTSRKTAADMKTAVDNMLKSGPTAMGDRLGAINWQFHPSRTFDAAYFSAFLAALPPEYEGVRLRHAIEVRDRSFDAPTFADLLRRHGCARVSADDDDWPMPDVETADFAYARLQRTRADVRTGYPLDEIAHWAQAFQSWARTREVYGFIISGEKHLNPHAAMAMIEHLDPARPAQPMPARSAAPAKPVAKKKAAAKRATAKPAARKTAKRG